MQMDIVDKIQNAQGKKMTFSRESLKQTTHHTQGIASDNRENRVNTLGDQSLNESKVLNYAFDIENNTHLYKKTGEHKLI